MKALCRLARGNRHPTKVVQAMAEGIRASGDEADTRRIKTAGRFEGTEKYDVGVQWSARFRKNLAGIRDSDKPIVYLELGHVGDREEWTSVGLNDINGMAERVVGDGDRWLELGWDKLLGDEKTYDHALIIGQVPNDLSVRECRNMERWYDRVARECQELGLKTEFRRHPLDKITDRNFLPYETSPSPHESLADAMENALVVTYSSNAGVEAAIAGHPVVASNHMSMLWGWAPRRVSHLKSWDREEWLQWLAWCQWSMNELRSGECWRHLRRRWLETPAWEAIRNRRSCRKFQDRLIDRDYLYKILEAGMWAPSSYNCQNQRFVVIDDRPTIDRLSKLKTPKRLVGSAAAWVLVLSDDMAHKTKPGEEWLWRGGWVQNCSASIQNMLLMATSLGIGSCWISWRDEMDDTRLLDGQWRTVLAEEGWEVPANHSIHGLVLLGWPTEERGGWPAGDRRHGGRLVEDRSLDRQLIGRTM